jgi:cell division septal protein FtsQ
VGSGDFAAKVERLSRIYQTLMAQRPAIQYIDLDYSDRLLLKRAS